MDNNYNGIQESPIGGVPSTGGTGGLPDPNHVVARPENVPQKDYNAQASSGARQARTEQVKREFSQPGQTLVQPSQGQHGELSQQGANQGGVQHQGVGAQTGVASQHNPQGRAVPSNAGGVSPQIGNTNNSVGAMQAQQASAQARQANMQAQQSSQPSIMGVPIRHGTPSQATGQMPNVNVPPQVMPTGQPLQQGAGGQFPQMQGQGVPSQGQGTAPQGHAQQPKKKNILPFIIIGIVAVVVIAIVAVKFLGKSEPEVALEQDYSTSGRSVYDKLLGALNEFDAPTIDGLIGVENADSYIAQEWAWVNGVQIREEFIQKVGSLVTFSYPKVQQLSTTGNAMTDADGNPIMSESYMNNGEAVTVTVPDYAAIMTQMEADKDYILQMLKSANYKPTDYTWTDELTNLMLQYILDTSGIPTRSAEVALTVRRGTDGVTLYIESDAELDNLLFNNEDMREMCAKWSQICTGWTGKKDEVYQVQEMAHNPEYDAWLELFLMYFEADGGVYDAATDTFSNVQKAYNKRTSKWEPWYLRDENNVIQTYEDGTYIVNYFSVKAEDGTDWIQPDANTLQLVDKVRRVDDPWVDEAGVMYNWIGCNFIQNEYTGLGYRAFRVGDGSVERPAGIGTQIITTILCTDGKYHDVKVSLEAYWTGQNAIDYAENFSTQNRGFTVESVVQLICFEIRVENLEDETIIFDSSEMTLLDRNRNISSRTGTLYGFTGTVVLEPDTAVIMNDWASSTELEQKYVGWGKSFARNFEVVYFDCLAGTGEVPAYSAYDQFVGRSQLSD